MRTYLAFVFLLMCLCLAEIYGIPAPSANQNGDEKDSVPKAARTAEDDSDMLMEPDEFHDSSILPSIFYSTEGQIAADSGFRPIINPDFTTTQHTTQYADDIPAPAAQNFFQSFFRDGTTPPLGHSRPYYPNGNQANQETIQPGNRFNAHRSAGNLDQSILGSGDFGVIRGGTFYQDNDQQRDGESNEFFNFHNNNGHGRPHTAPYVQRFTYPEEQFANFRDFADINTPTDPAYSQFVVVYANKNSTGVEHPNPKNIFEQLQLLDKEKAAQEKKTKGVISKHKTKLAATKLEKKYRKQLGPKEDDLLAEPLLALS